MLELPSACADGPVDAEEFRVEWYQGTWMGRGTATTGEFSIEDNACATYTPSFNFSVFDVDTVNITAMRAYVEWQDTNDAFSRDWWYSVYVYVSAIDAGALVDSETWLKQNLDGDPLVRAWNTRTLTSPWELASGKYFFAVETEDSAGSVRLQGTTGGDASSGRIVDRFNDPLNDPFVEYDTYSQEEHSIQIKYWGYKDDSTTINQYYGDSENYTARRDVNYTFPSGVSNKKYSITIPTEETLVNITYSNGGLWDETLSVSDYMVSTFNSTHKLITISNIPLSIYGSAYRIFTQSFDYVYHLYGPYFENGTSTQPKTVTVTKTDTSEEIEVNGYYLYTTDDPVTMFTWTISDGETRRYYPLTPTETIYLFEPDGTYATYGFDIRDYPGIIGTNVCFLEAIRSVNGTDRIIERNIIWNTHSPVPMILTKNKVYLLRVLLEDGTYYTFGYFTPGDYAPPTLSITGLGFSDYYQPIVKWVNMELTRPNSTHIKMVYTDDLLITVTVSPKITLRNGTEVWSDYQTENSYTFNWYGADPRTEYIANLTAEHALYGSIYKSVIFIGEIDTFDPPDFSSIGIDTSLVSVFLIFTVAGTVSRWNRTAGMFAASAIASMLTVIEWISIPYPLLATAFALSIISGFGGR